MRTVRGIGTLTVGLASLALLLGVAGSASARIADPSSSASLARTIAPPAPTTARLSAQRLAAEVLAVRRATRGFHSIAAAETAGYGLFKDTKGVACIAMPGMGAMGVHWVNGDLVGHPAIRLRHPEAMVYAPTRNGTLRLAAVEYVVLAAAWHQSHPGAPVLFGHRFTYTAAGNRYGLPAFFSLHAWVWKHNPAGKFAMWNPRVHCG